MRDKKVCILHWGLGYSSKEAIETAYCDFYLFKYALQADHVSLIPPTLFSVATVKDFLKYDILFFDGWAVEDLTDTISKLKMLKPEIQIFFFECGSPDMIFNQGGPADRLYLSKKWVNSFDKFLTYSEQSSQFYDPLFPGRVAYVGCPIEMGKAIRLKESVSKKDQVLLFGDTGYMGNLVNHLAIARQLPGIEKIIIVPNLGEYAPFIHLFNGFKIPNLKFSDLMIHETFIHTLCESRLCINLTGKASFGRIALMGALLGTPILGPDLIQNQRELFPSLTIPFWEIKKAACLAQSVLDDSMKYADIIDQAYKQVQKFSFESCAKRFWEIADVSV